MVYALRQRLLSELGHLLPEAGRQMEQQQVVQGCAFIRLYCAMKGIAGLRWVWNVDVFFQIAVCHPDNWHCKKLKCQILFSCQHCPPQTLNSWFLYPEYHRDYIQYTLEICQSGSTYAHCRFDEQEGRVLLQLVMSHPPPTQAGVRFICLGLCMLLACPYLLA